jgi:hypothetical protein
MLEENGPENDQLQGAASVARQSPVKLRADLPDSRIARLSHDSKVRVVYFTSRVSLIRVI